MSTSSLTVRPLVPGEEYNRYFSLSNTAFSSRPSEEEARDWQRFLLQSPTYRTEQVRGAFREEQLLGGYTMHERMMRMGEARISTGCIGSVVTMPEARKQGVATALLHDALAFAREHHHALLLLDGIPNFYFRYGYTDMFDVTVVEVDRSALLAQPDPQHQVRPATVEDAPALLALYQRHAGAYTGSFERSLESQVHRERNRRLPCVVALTAQGEIEGYLVHGSDDELAEGREVAADNWDALLALLRYHAQLCESNQPVPTTLLYFLPFDAPMTHWLIDTLAVPDTSQWHSPSTEWGVRGLSYHHRFTGWMSSLVDFPLLLDSMLPELQARWQRALAQWTGEIMLTVEGQSCVLQLDGAHLRLADSPSAIYSQVELTPQALVQLVFGYRPLASLTSIAYLPEDVQSALMVLFPQGHTWIPRSDWF